MDALFGIKAAGSENQDSPQEVWSIEHAEGIISKLEVRC